MANFPRIAPAVAVLFAVGSCDSVEVQETDSASAETVGKHGAQVEICHANGDGYSLLQVAQPAVERHLGHGDGFPENSIMDMPGYFFDDTCEPQEAECPCWTGKEAVFDRAVTRINYDGPSDVEFQSTMLAQPYGPHVHYDFPWYGYKMCHIDRLVIIPIRWDQAVACVNILLEAADSCIGVRCPDELRP